MVEVIHVILIIAALTLALLFLKGSCTKDDYRFLGGAYQATQGGSHAELNEECLSYPGNNFCMLTDGTPGVCVQNGMCVADMTIDLMQYRSDIKLPSCTEPVFKEGCGRFCRCKELKGTINPKDHMSCVENCKSWFSPIPTSFPF